MATIPDKLLKDIRAYLDGWQAVSDEAESIADKLVYGIDLTAKYDNADCSTEDKP